ncbi:MAG: tRNA lysidine(34) synthetase TilS [Pelagibacteraceae bacterium]
MSKKNSNVQNLKKIIEKNNLISKIYLDFKIDLKELIRKKPFLVAVSGGPDSLALVALANTYKNEMKNKVSFVLVDHSIRKNSNKEANLVKSLLKKEGIYLDIVKNKEKIVSNVQNHARLIRYNLIANYCKKKKIKFILTGHHSDDQIETFLIRLSRGSGVQGLSSMNKISTLTNNIKIIRPLLEFKKKDLSHIAKGSFGKVITDPSNRNKKYLRTKIRFLKKQLEKSGIHHNQIIRSIKNLASARDIINNHFTKVFKNCVIKKGKKIKVNLKRFLLESEEIQLKIIGSIIKDLSKSYYPPRSVKILNLINKIKDAKDVKYTLGKCVFNKLKDNLYIEKEV